MTLAALAAAGLPYNDEMFQINGTGALDPVITGGGSQVDGSDASYVKVQHTTTSTSYAAVDLQSFELPFGSAINSIVVSLRARGNSNHSSPSSTYVLHADITGIGATYDVPGPIYPNLYGAVEIPMTDTFVNADHAIDQAEISFNSMPGISTMYDLAELFAAGATLHFWVSTPSGFTSYADIAAVSVAIDFTEPVTPQVRAVPGQTEVQVVARSRANKLPRELREVPGGLYPLMSSAWEVDEYRILAGWPVPVPELDIQIDVVVTGDGSVIGNRQAPTSLLTEADVRWVADDDYYDVTTLTWTPMQGDLSGWHTDPDHAPTLIHDYEYRVGDERFVGMTALNFDSNTDNYMWNDLSLGLGGTTGYTVIMVLNPNSIYGNDEDVTANALWGPNGDKEIDGSWVTFTVRDQAVCLTSDEQPRQVGVPIGDQLSTSAPTYLGLVVGKPQTTLYAAVGPSMVKVKSLVAGEVPTALRTDFWLGRGTSTSIGTMDMALLDLGIYVNQLSGPQVRREFATLSGVYGGDS